MQVRALVLPSLSVIECIKQIKYSTLRVVININALAGGSFSLGLKWNVFGKRMVLWKIWDSSKMTPCSLHQWLSNLSSGTPSCSMYLIFSRASTTDSTCQLTIKHLTSWIRWASSMLQQNCETPWGHWGEVWDPLTYRPHHLLHCVRLRVCVYVNACICVLHVCFCTCLHASVCLHACAYVFMSALQNDIVSPHRNGCH